MAVLGEPSFEISHSTSPEGQPPKKNRLRLTNRRNPFDSGTLIEFTLHEVGPATLKIYKINGQLVRTFLNKNLTTGRHLVNWDGLDEKGKKVPCGVYFYRIEHGGCAQTGKMLLVK